ncbi:flagellar biosynthesis protein FlhF [Halobacillus naozhouensis]|uniref:Flagellar biosynthesis protein FlhF n=1 Tax=Halobacillus naozhouensis TaxID=554880 RepID=A0ABY8J2M7_9BACI|nr:flagellar biosynthesis protein FlhF [Halobacillus naozhouensis]WFT76754.1 flagellar biosynthesis protein FlhF [Halobacillus naozhouensis]
MKVKKFQAGTMPEVMEKVKQGLGTDAVILNSKPIQTGGVLGFFKKTEVEVIAAIDPVSRPVAKKVPKGEVMASSLKEESNDEVLKELKSLKVMLQEQTNQSVYSETIDKIYQLLIEQEIEPGLARTVTDQLLDVSEEEEKLDGQWEALTNEILKQKISHLSFGPPSFKKKFIHLVGPTGVGKTTTVAKMAADAVLDRKLSVAFITTDTYRIAAIDQLKTYAKILDVPLEVAYNLDDYMQAREKLNDYDLVFIDTAGRNFRDEQYVRELNQLIHFSEDSETYLVLSLTSKYRDMTEIYEQFTEIPIEKLIFTKKDEASRVGSAVSMALNHDIGIAYVTHGQNVPDDIKPASREALIHSVMEGTIHG